MITISLPIHAISEANVRSNRFAKAKRVKEQRKVAKKSLLEVIDDPAVNRSKEPLFAWRDGPPKKKTWGPLSPVKPLAVVLTRVGARPLDNDNLATSCKAVRDGIADALGVDDGDEEACTWDYKQRKGKPKEYAVEVTICERIPKRIIRVDYKHSMPISVWDAEDVSMHETIVWDERSLLVLAETEEEARNTVALYLGAAGVDFIMDSGSHIGYPKTG